MKFDSNEEKAFYNWCVEAKQKSIIENFTYQPEPIQIFPPHEYMGLKGKNYTLLQGMKYTPDFLILGAAMADYHMTKNKILDEKGKHSYLNDGYFYIDIKGGFSRFGDSKQFSIVQKCLYNVAGIYVNKVVPERFFKQAWLPRPMQDKDDPVWCNYKPGETRKKRSLYKECKIWRNS